MKFKELYTTVAVILLNMVLMLTVAELITRRFDHHTAPALQKLLVDIHLDYAPYRMQRQLSAPFALNSDGFRAPELSTITQQTFNIVFTGGSTCAGFGGNTGPAIADHYEEMLHQAGLTQAKVVNLCQGGAVSAQELPIFWQYGMPLAPSVVIQFTGANDIFHVQPVGDDAVPNLPYMNEAMQSLWSRPEAPVINLRLTGYLSHLFDKAQQTVQPASTTVPPQAITAPLAHNITAMHRLAGPQALHIVMLQPTLFYRHTFTADETQRMEDIYRFRPAGTLEHSQQVVTARYQATQGALSGLARTLANYQFIDATGAFQSTSQTTYIDSVHFEGQQPNRALAELLFKQTSGSLKSRYQAWLKSQR